MYAFLQCGERGYSRTIRHWAPNRIPAAAVRQPVTAVEVAERAAGSIIAKGALCRRTPIDLGQYLLDDPAAGLGLRYFQRRLAVEDCQIFAKPPVRLRRVAENILSQCLDPRQPHDPIGFLNRQWLSLGLAMPLRPLRDDKSTDLLL